LSEAQSRLGETLSPEREFDEILAVVTVGPSPRREGGRLSENAWARIFSLGEDS